MSIAPGLMFVTSQQRSALLTIEDGENRTARYIRFLDAYLPKNARILLPPEYSFLSDQSKMQYYLSTRTILACDAIESAACKKNLADPNTYILAVGGFPPSPEQPGRVFVRYPDRTNFLNGVYVPEDQAQRLPVPESATYSKTTPIHPSALLVDGLIIVLMLLFGFLLTSLFLRPPEWLDLFTLSFPLAIGILTWVIFLLSYVGIKISLAMVALTYTGLIVIVLVAHYLAYKTFPQPPKINNPLTNNACSDWLTGVIIALVSAVILFAGFLSIVRGYSTHDDMVNWALKGYAMVDFGTIWAAKDWGGHVMAYPMNIPLSIGLFRMADGDILPGSKSIFVLLVISLLIGCYRYLIRNGAPKPWAAACLLVIATIPIFFIHATLGFANLPFAIYLVLGILYSLEGLRLASLPRLLLGGLCFAFAAWTRPEGIMFSAAFLILIYLLAFIYLKIQLRPVHFILSFAPLLIIPGSWLILIGAAGLGGDQIGNTLSIYLGQLMLGNLQLQGLSVLVAFIANELKSFQAYGAIMVSWLAIILFIPITAWHQDKFKVSFVLLSLFAFVLPLFMLYVAAPGEENYWLFLAQSFNRAFFPGMILGLMAATLAISNKPAYDS